MNCEQFRAMLHEYLDCEVGEVREALAAEHLAVCADCAREASEMRRTRSLVKQCGAELAPEGFEAAVRARIEAELARKSHAQRAPRGRALSRSSSNYRRRWAALAASFAVVVLFGAYIGIQRFGSPGGLNRALMPEKAMVPSENKKSASNEYAAADKESLNYQRNAETNADAASSLENRVAERAPGGSAGTQPVAPKAPPEAPRAVPRAAPAEAKPAGLSAASGGGSARVDNIMSSTADLDKSYYGKGESVVTFSGLKEESEAETAPATMIPARELKKAKDSGGGDYTDSISGAGGYSSGRYLTNQAIAVENAISNYERRFDFGEASADHPALSLQKMRIDQLESQPSVADVAYNPGGSAGGEDFKPSNFDSDLFNALNESAGKLYSGKSAPPAPASQYQPAAPVPSIIIRASDAIPSADPKSAVERCKKLIAEFAAANPGVQWRWAGNRFIIQGAYAKLQPLRIRLNNELRQSVAVASAAESKPAPAAGAPGRSRAKAYAKPPAYPSDMPAMLEIGFYQTKADAPAAP